MDWTRPVVIARQMAAIVLMLCFVLPLSRCDRKADPAGQAVTAPSVSLHGVDLAREGWGETQAGSMSKGAALLLAVFTTFFVPFVCLPLGAHSQAITGLLSTPPAVYFLYHWVFVFSTRAEIGGFLALACWAVLCGLNVVTLFGWWRGGALFKHA